METRKLNFLEPNGRVLQANVCVSPRSKSDYHIGIQMLGFQNHFFNPISADAAALSTKAENHSQIHMS